MLQPQILIKLVWLIDALIDRESWRSTTTNPCTVCVTTEFFVFPALNRVVLREVVPVPLSEQKSHYMESNYYFGCPNSPGPQ